MTHGAKRMSASAHFLSASRTDLSSVETAEFDYMANTDDNDVAAIRCEEWDANAELERALYEHASSSCETVKLLRASWCSKTRFKIQ
jgi:hypothetical protein